MGLLVLFILAIIFSFIILPVGILLWIIFIIALILKLITGTGKAVVGATKLTHKIITVTRCPYCKSEMRYDATICPSCGSSCTPKTFEEKVEIKDEEKRQNINEINHENLKEQKYLTKSQTIENEVNKRLIVKSDVEIANLKKKINILLFEKKISGFLKIDNIKEDTFTENSISKTIRKSPELQISIMILLFAGIIFSIIFSVALGLSVGIPCFLIIVFILMIIIRLLFISDYNNIDIYINNLEEDLQFNSLENIEKRKEKIKREVIKEQLIKEQVIKEEKEKELLKLKIEEAKLNSLEAEIRNELNKNNKV